MVKAGDFFLLSTSKKESVSTFMDLINDNRVEFKPAVRGEKN